MRGLTLVCFAVKQEAEPFRRLAASRSNVSILLTGMGRRNAEDALRSRLHETIRATNPGQPSNAGTGLSRDRPQEPDLQTSSATLSSTSSNPDVFSTRRAIKRLLRQVPSKPPETAPPEVPALVLTCGFAGALRSDLTLGTVVFDADPEARLDAALLAAGAKPARFHCAERVAATAAEKRTLRETTGADAVELESKAIRDLCRRQGVPAATVRVILDAAEEDLALDFNRVVTPGWRIDPRKLALALARSPAKLPAMLRLQKQSRLAASKLAAILAEITLKPG